MLADFLTEARHISHLVHPHLIRVFDFGLESDTPFLVMDYAPHGNLRQKHHSWDSTTPAHHCLVRYGTGLGFTVYP